MSKTNTVTRAACLTLVAMTLAACRIEIEPSITNAADEEARTRTNLARHLEGMPNFASVTPAAPASAGGGANKGVIEDAMISGPNTALMLGGRVFYCVEIKFAGGNTDAFKRYAKAEFLISPSSGNVAPVPNNVAEERCTDVKPYTRFEELIALRQAALRR